MRAIEDRERLFVIGPRRHGKTAVLNAAVREARRNRALIVFIDAEACAPHHLPTSTFSKTLRWLEERSILRREEAGRQVRWRFEDPFFALWLRRSAPCRATSSRTAEATHPGR